MDNQLMATANKTVETIVCYAPTMITTNGIWQGDNPLDYSLPLFILQLTLVVVTTRLLVYILKPLRQPRVISEILVSFIFYDSYKRVINLFASMTRNSTCFRKPAMNITGNMVSVHVYAVTYQALVITRSWDYTFVVYIMFQTPCNLLSFVEEVIARTF